MTSQKGYASQKVYTSQKGYFSENDVIFCFKSLVGLYAKNSDQRVSLLEKHIGGVTQVKFIDGYLLSGGRMVGLKYSP